MGVLAQVANEAILERHVIIELPFVGVVFQRPPAEVAAENFAAAIDGAEVLVRCGGVDIGHELLDDQLLGKFGAPGKVRARCLYGLQNGGLLQELPSQAD